MNHDEENTILRSPDFVSGQVCTPLICKRCWHLVAVVFLLFAWGGRYACAFQTTGTAIVSVHVDLRDGPAISGVEVTLLRNGKRLAEFRTDSHGDGSVRITNGSLTISIRQPGMIPVDQGVTVSGDIAYKIDLLQNLRAEESVTVQATGDEITDQTSSPGAAIKPEEANESPLRPLTVTDALPLIPGVVQAPNGQTQIEGAGELHSTLLINNLDVSDPATGRFGLTVPIDVVNSLTVLTTPYLAQYGRFSAGVVSAETKSGTNRWHYDLNDPLPEFRIRSGHVQGLRSATPRLSFGGPLVRDRLFLSEGFEFVQSKVPVRTLQYPFNESKTTSANSFTQFDFNVNARQTITASVHTAPQSYQYVNLGFFNPISVTPNAEVRYNAGALTHRLQLRGGLLESTVSSSVLSTSITPQGPLDMIVRPDHNEGNYFSEQIRQSRRFEWNEVWSLQPKKRLGDHRVQFGTSLARTTDNGSVQNRPVTLLDNQGIMFRTISFSQGSPVNLADVQPAVFAQDHWSITPGFALDAGVRFESQFITNTKRAAPRLGFVWRPRPNKGTIIRGGAGNFFDSVPLNVYAFSRFPEQTITDFAANGTVIGTPQHYSNVLAQTADSQFPLVGREENLGNFAPYAVAWNVEVQQGLSSHLTVRAKYLESHGGGLLAISSQNFPGRNAYVIAGSGSSLYRQFEVTAQVSLQKNRQFNASCVRSLSTGTINEADTYLEDFAAPFIRGNLYSNRVGDLPNRLLAWGSVSLPLQITISPRIELRSGFPYQSIDAYQNFVLNGGGRFPTFFVADVRIAKDVKVSAKYTIRPSVIVSNVTNHFNPIEVRSNTSDPLYGSFFGNYNRRLRLDLDFVF